MTVLTLGFGDAACESVDVSGGKGASLSRLARAGLPIPPGFVVTTAAYEAFLDDNGLTPRIAMLLESLDPSGVAALEACTTEIRDLLTAAPMPLPTVQAVAEAYRALGRDRPVAVRSSGTAEDTADASFAGLHDTYLHMKGEAKVLDAVRRCWASMWTSRAVAYRAQTGFDHRSARIAVVVQDMIDAEVSGVMFTSNPLNARTDEIVVNASWGLGEGIVSGILMPDEVTLERQSLHVRRRSIGSKEKEVVRDPATGQGTVAIDVDEKRREAQSIADADLRRLVRVGLEVERFYGSRPQDIEWAIAGGEVFILQSRPITGVEFTWDEDVDRWQPVPDRDDTIWSGGWAAEFWSGAVTPLFYSIRSREIRARNERIYGLLGFRDLLDFRLLRYRRATVFYNVEVDARLYSYLLPSSLRAGALGYLPSHLKERAAREPMRIWRFATAMARVYLFNRSQTIGNWERELRRYSADRIDNAHFASREELRSWSDDEVRTYALDQSRTADEFLERTSLGVYVYSKFTLGYLKRMIDKWSRTRDPFAFQDIISGLPVHTRMAEENNELWHLVQTIRRSPLLLDAFGRHPGPAFLDVAEDFDEGRTFLASYRAFVGRHGHRGHADRDIYFARRVEEPRIDTDAIALMLKADDPTPPDVLERRLVERREAMTNQILSEIREGSFGAAKAWIFRRVHAWVLKFLVMRDDWRHTIDRVTLAKKWSYSELGRRAHERGLLANPRDFFFLSEQELFDLLDGKSEPSVAAFKTAARAKVFDAFLARREQPPAYLQGSTPADFETFADASDAAVMKGIGISRGVVRARARVVADIKDIGRIAPGEILVCNSTDPAWAPVFPVIRGLVLELGGMLSHGACLSREYGLPAVQLRLAMQKIEDGQLIEVSGDSGTVRVVDDTAQETASEAAQ